MKGLLFLLLAAVTGGVAPAPTPPPDNPADAPLVRVDDSKEPPLEYTLVLGGRADGQTSQREIRQDELVTIPGNFTNPVVKLTASPTRIFPYGGVSFVYPAQFSWEASESTDNKKTWTLSGIDCKIIFIWSADEIKSKRVVQTMADKFGAPSTAIRDISKRFGDVDLDGYTLEISQGGLYLTVDVLDVPTKEGGRVLILQDSPPENTARSPEAVKATDLLAKSFKVTLDEK